ncbi:MAG TPA: hypothetical protein VFJ06_07810 [Halococcus sp.]|nr:hypothetical protein [Halococcus sp.]
MPTANARLIESVMVAIYTLMDVLHLVVAGVWAGWTMFMAALVVPVARDGRLGADALDWMTGWFVRVSQAAPVIMLLTGGYMVSQGAITGTPLDSLRGQLVVTMVVLWIVLSGLSNAAGRRLTDGIEAGGVESAAHRTTMLFYGAGVVALLLLVVGGWL